MTEALRPPFDVGSVQPTPTDIQTLLHVSKIVPQGIEILESIEAQHRAFARANGLDDDFCSNNVSDDAECGCKLASINNCVGFVSFDSNGPSPGGNSECFTNFEGDGLTGQCSASETEYTIAWTAWSNIGLTTPGDPAIGCVGASETFQCPSRVVIPFFTRINVLITILMIIAIYFVIRKDLEDNEK